MPGSIPRRVEREHVQPRGVHQQVLAGSRGPQLAVGLLRPVRDVPVAFRAQPKQRVPTLQVFQHPERCGAARLGNGARAEPGDHPRLGPLDHRCARRLGLPGVLCHHLQRGFHPPVIDLQALPVGELIAADQPCLAASLEALHPALDGATSDAQFGRLIGATFVQRPVRRILPSRLSFLRHLGRPRPVSRTCRMRHPYDIDYEITSRGVRPYSPSTI